MNDSLRNPKKFPTFGLTEYQGYSSPMNLDHLPFEDLTTGTTSDVILGVTRDLDRPYPLLVRTLVDRRDPVAQRGLLGPMTEADTLEECVARDFIANFDRFI